MAPKRNPRCKLSKSAKYYRDNPKAAKRKSATDKKVNAKSSQKAKRRELGKKNYAHDKKNGKGARKGLDYDHATGRYVSQETNRGRSSGTRGDKRARGKKK